MESRFNKYKSENKSVATHIANINSFIDSMYNSLDLIELEINDLQRRIDEGNAPAIFSNKIDHLIKLGERIENAHETYHYNRGN